MDVIGIVKCSYCGKETYLPFKCPYCGKYFCVEHRLPESHECPERWRARAPKKEVLVKTEAEAKPAYTYKTSYVLGAPTQKMVWFSLKEIQHLIIGMILVFLVGFSFYLYELIFGRTAYLAKAIILGFFIMLSFILHEVAHKIAAQLQGLWAEFRLLLFGVLLTMISILLIPFKLISPGAVLIAGAANIKKMGKTALAGPLTNIFLAFFFILLASLLSKTAWADIFLVGAWINAFVGFFNLIPFGMLDGFKIFLWNKKSWTLTFLISLALTIYTGSQVF